MRLLKSKLTFNILLILVVNLVLISCSSESKSNLQFDKKHLLDQRVDEIMANLSLEDKVGQMTQITIDVITKGNSVYTSDEPVEIDSSKLEEAISKYRIGSVLNTAGNTARSVEKWNSLISEIQKKAMEKLSIPIIYGVDAIHGATYTKGATFFPQQIGIAATWNLDLAKSCAELSAYETRASSIPWNFSPVLDLGRDPRWPRMWETFGEDVYLASRMGYYTVKGLEGENNDLSNPTKVAACIKHFLAYGSEKSGKDRTPSYIPEIELRERYLPSYRAAIDAGAHSIMINSGLINGVPVHADYNILTELLRNELKFDGVIVTDWADIENLHNRDRVAQSHKEAVKMAINAGIDMAMVPYNYNFTTNLIELVREGEVKIERVNDAVRRIIRLKLELGLFEKPYPKIGENQEFGSDNFKNTAFQAAVESITLLKNEGGIAPISKNAKLLVVGPNANSMRAMNGGWTYSWQGDKASLDEFTGQYNTFLKAIENKIGKNNLVYSSALEYDDSGKYWEEKALNLEDAVSKAKYVDIVVVFVGENSYTETPGNLNELDLSVQQQELVKALANTGKKIILVLNQGRPRLINKIEPLAAGIFNVYLPGNYGGDAFAEILFGEQSPSGRLPFSYPMYSNALGNYDHKPSEMTGTMDGIYDYNSSLPFQYQFGYGLSYTTFEYGAISISKDEVKADEEFVVSITVTNTGKMDSKEVVQLYSSDKYASISPDNKRLRRFEKIFLKAGESKKINFSLSSRDLAFVNRDNKTVVEKGLFTFAIGNQNCQLILSETKIY